MMTAVLVGSETSMQKIRSYYTLCCGKVFGVGGCSLVLVLVSFFNYQS